MKELLDLLHAAGHSDFRDARGPLGLNQRQAAGKFTRDEADEFIARLQDEAQASDSANGESTESRAARPAVKPKLTPAERSLKSVPSEVLAAELQSRGWVVLEP